MFEKFICESPFCKEDAKWPKRNPYLEHNVHEEAVRDALHQAERDNVIKDEIIDDLRKKLAKSEEKHKKATKMVKALMKERNILNTSLRNRIEKVDELLVKNAELKKTIKGYEGELVKGSYISMSEYDNAIKERNVYMTKSTAYERLYDDVCKRYNELDKKFDFAVDKCVAAKLSNREKPMYRDSQLHKDNLKTIYKLEQENKRLADENEKLKSRRQVIFRVENDGISLQTFVTASKYEALEQKYWDAQRLIDKYAQSEEKTKEYLNALAELYFDECVKTRKGCPLFGGFRGGKIFGDHGETGGSEML